MELLSAVGTVASILGLAASLWVLRQVSEIKRQYLRRVRSPALLKRLADQEQTLSKLLLPPTLDVAQVSVVLASSESLLRNLLPKTSGSESKRLKATIKVIARTRAEPIDKTATLAARAELVSAIEAATEQHKDTQWMH